MVARCGHHQSNHEQGQKECHPRTVNSQGKPGIEAGKKEDGYEYLCVKSTEFVQCRQDHFAEPLLGNPSLSLVGEGKPILPRKLPFFENKLPDPGMEKCSGILKEILPCP